MTFVNLTPHAISLVKGDGSILVIEPSGQLARMQTETVVSGFFNGVEIRRTVHGEVSGLPAPQDGVLYITSTLVAQVVRRADVVSPDTGPTALRENGQVKAVTGVQSFI